MSKETAPTKRITEDDPLTLEEEYELQRINSLPPRQQQMAIESLVNRFNATPGIGDKRDDTESRRAWQGY